MTKSHGHQQIALFNALVKRAQSGACGLSKGAMTLAYDFDNEEQLNHALQALVESKRIAIDIDGRFPAIRIYQAKYHAARPLNRALFLSPGTGAPTTPTPAATETSRDISVRAPAKPVEPVKMPPQSDEPQEPDNVVPLYAQFKIAREDAEWLLDEINGTSESISFPALCKQLFQAELDRRRSPDGLKHKITADVIRAAREEQRDLGEFVTSMIAVGMQARAMNRKGI